MLDATNAPPHTQSTTQQKQRMVPFFIPPHPTDTNPEPSADMADPDKRAEWQEVTDNSNGRYKTARGVALASYYAGAIE